MSDFRELRARQTWQVAERRSIWPTVLGVVAAFAVGGLAVIAWSRMPSPSQWLPFMAADTPNTPPSSFDGSRVGRAETAPLLARCVNPAAFGVSDRTPVPAAVLWQALSAGSTASRFAAMFGQPNRRGEAGLAARWAEVTDCVYRQNRNNFCDPDNRALAVEAVNSFMRHSARFAANPNPSAEARAIVQTRRRVLDELKVLVADGELIAADFGAFAAPAVRHALGVTRTVANGCAKK